MPQNTVQTGKKSCALQILSIKGLLGVKNVDPWDLLGGPVAKTLHLQGRGPGFSPWSGNKVSHAASKDPTCHN